MASKKPDPAKEASNHLPYLYGNGDINDSGTIRHLFLGGRAIDRRTGEVIKAQTLKELPAGSYRLYD